MKSATLAEVTLAIVDCEHKSAPVSVDGTHFAVGTPAMRGNRINFAESRRISLDTFNLWTRRLRPQVGDLLLAREAPVGPVVRIPVSEDVAPGQRTVLIRPNPEIADSSFLYFLLTSPAQQALLLNKAAGSIVDHLNVADVRALKIVLPSLQQQVAVAAVLGALDGKIAADRNLGVAIGALVDSKFAAIAAEAVHQVPFGNLISVVKGVSYRAAELSDSRTALVTLKSVTSDGLYAARGLKSFIGPHKVAQIVRPGDAIVALTDLTQAGEVVGRAVRVPYSRVFETLVASLDLAIVRPTDAVPASVLMGIMRLPSFRAHCRDRARGTTVLHLEGGAIESFLAPVVTPEAAADYAAQVEPMLDLMDATENEIDALSRLRDTLLPALMSGKLRVRDAEKAVEDVL